MYTLMEFSSILKKMYEEAPIGESTTMIHLFGIKYAKEIMEADFSVKDILFNAKMSTSYQTEVHKGVRLAKYVYLK